jgi:F5/8 type C domain
MKRIAYALLVYVLASLSAAAQIGPTPLVGPLPHFLSTPVNIIPTMTSDSAPSGTASASTEYTGAPCSQASGNAFYAMDGSSATAWFTNSVNTGWLQYHATSVYSPTSYSIMAYNSAGCASPNSARAPKSWQFQSSTDGSTFATCDTQTNFTFSDGVLATFTLTSPCAGGSYFRLNVTANNGDPSFVNVVTFQVAGVK